MVLQWADGLTYRSNGVECEGCRNCGVTKNREKYPMMYTHQYLR